MYVYICLVVKMLLQINLLPGSNSNNDLVLGLTQAPIKRGYYAHAMAAFRAHAKLPVYFN